MSTKFLTPEELHESLKSAYAQIENIDGWAQGTTYVDDNGISAYNPEDAVKCCAIGAALKALSVRSYESPAALGQMMEPIRGCAQKIWERIEEPSAFKALPHQRTIIGLNDFGTFGDRTPKQCHAHVCEMYRCAIEATKPKEETDVPEG